MRPTELMYLSSDRLQEEAEVLSCTANGECFDLVLDRTLFHPKGGGQPADAGRIGDVRVLDVLLAEGQVVHTVDAPVAEGRVLLRVDAEARRLHSALHSAGHLIGHAGTELGLRPQKAQHWPGQSRVVFSVPEELPGGWQAALQQRVAALREADLPRRITVDDWLRQVAFGELPAFPCGGTYVRSLGGIAQISITSAKLKSRELSLSYTATAAG